MDEDMAKHWDVILSEFGVIADVAEGHVQCVLRPVLSLSTSSKRTRRQTYH